MGYRIGADIGGTFTDFCILDEVTGEMRSLKVLSTPQKPGQEVLVGLREIERRYGIKPADVTYFTHGTTVGVNTVIQRKGANLALFATAGFEDVLEVARLKMPDPYDLFSRRAEPLVPRERAFGIAERVLADGTILKPVVEADVRAALAAARREGADHVVVALLHAYANSENERKVAAQIKAIDPDIGVTLSSAVWPVIREYERTVTATVAGYVQQRIVRYLGQLQQALREVGVRADAMIAKSNGGVMTVEAAKSQAIQMLLSGTASGVIGAARIAAAAGAPSVLSFDVGGTSADVAIIADAKPSYGVGEMVGEFPIYIPTVSVTSIGAGGGSIAHVDQQGVLKVGPESAGSSPGPACYGRGGERATITDAYAVSGFLGSGELGYGAVTIDLARARTAISAIADRLGLGIEETAEAIIKVSISGMFLEVSKLFSRQGADPRHFALLPFGGAGPMTACFLARDLGMRRIVVPPTPGVLAAFGGLIADMRNDYIRTAFVELDEVGLATLRGLAADLTEVAMASAKGMSAKPTLIWSADMRYRGQSYEIEVALERAWIERGDLAAIAGAFHREHERVYEYADAKAAVQIVNLRVVASSPAPQPKPFDQPARARLAVAAAQTRVFYDGRWHTAGLYDRSTLEPGHHLDGPAIIRQDDCTTCIVDGYRLTVDTSRNLIIDRI